MDSPRHFTSNTAIIGRVKADADLRGNFGAITPGYNGILSIYSVTSNATQNFASSNGQFLIGVTSGASAQINKILDLNYQSITSQISNIYPNQTDILWSFKGTDTNRSVDTLYNGIDNEIPYEFIDKSRMLMSRSNEYAYSSGNNSLSVFASLGTFNKKIKR
jgi:hypothetical protein